MVGAVDIDAHDRAPVGVVLGAAVEVLEQRPVRPSRRGLPRCGGHGLRHDGIAVGTRGVTAAGIPRAFMWSTNSG